VLINNVDISPAGMVAVESSQFPLSLGAGETRPIYVRLLVDRSTIMDSVFSATLVTNGIQPRMTHLRIAATSSVGSDDRAFVIAPNPVQNAVRFQFPAPGRRTVRIVDALGKLAYLTTTEQRELVVPVSALGDGAAIGMYSVAVVDATGTHTSSFIVTP